MGPVKVGILANEFFDPAVSRMGGFGWAARSVAQAFADRRGVDVAFVAANRRVRWRPRRRLVHGRPFIEPWRDPERRRHQLDAERLDLLLTIDYRPSYDEVLEALPATPAVIWIRDPRTPDDVRKVSTLVMPWASVEAPRGIDPIDCSGLAAVARRSAADGRLLQLATPELALAAKVEPTYGVPPDGITLLPNIIDVTPETVPKSVRPTVVFLGRLDPIKRPWMVAEIARAMPDVQFLMLGAAHFGRAMPADVPANVLMLGHVDGVKKRELVGAAWALVNTSIHEALAVSFLEALSCETPLVSCQDTGGIATRFGKYVGQWDGDGLPAIPAFVDALQQLLADDARRRRLGTDGRRWVVETHSRDAFERAFNGLVERARSSAVRTQGR